MTLILLSSGIVNNGGVITRRDAAQGFQTVAEYSQEAMVTVRPSRIYFDGT